MNHSFLCCAAALRLRALVLGVVALGAAVAASAQPATQNLFPINGQAGVSTNPTLEIDCSSPGIVAAQYRIASDLSLSNLVFDSGEDVNHVCSLVALANLTSLTPYYWAARVKDGSGTWSSWSTPTTFTTVDASALHVNVFQDGIQGYAGTADADIRGSYADPNTAIREWNQGAQDVLRTGRRPPGSDTDEIYRTLIRFDLSTLSDPNAVVNAYLELTGWQHSGSTFFLASNSLYAVLRPWGEGTGTTGTPPGPGEVSWTYSAEPVPWSIPGAAHASDVDPDADRSATAITRVIVANQVGYKTRWSSHLLVGLVRQWIADPSRNDGLLLKTDDESSQLTLDLASREQAEPFFHPRLVIVSTEAAARPPDQPPVAVDDRVFADPGTPVRIPALANDSDTDIGPDPIRIVSAGTPGAGTAAIDGSDIVYTPGPGFGAGDSFTYAIADGELTASATVTITNSLECRRGNVNAGAGAIADVLYIEGSVGGVDRTVTVGIGQPVTVTLNTAPDGPNPGRFVLWVWPRPPSLPVDLVVRGSLIGCLADPTPFHRGLRPQPIRCLRSAGVPSSACGSAVELPSPGRAPWTLTRTSGVLRAVTFTLQGLLQDSRAANPVGYSVTNAIILAVQ